MTAALVAIAATSVAVALVAAWIVASVEREIEDLSRSLAKLVRSLDASATGALEIEQAGIAENPRACQTGET